MGTGGIAEDVVSMMDCLPGTEIVAIGARKEVEDAREFADKHGKSKPACWPQLG